MVYYDFSMTELGRNREKYPDEIKWLFRTIPEESETNESGMRDLPVEFFWYLTIWISQSLTDERTRPLRKTDKVFIGEKGDKWVTIIFVKEDADMFVDYHYKDLPKEQGDNARRILYMIVGTKLSGFLYKE